MGQKKVITKTDTDTKPVEASASASKKSAKKQVLNGIAHINISYNNTLIAVSDLAGNVLAFSSSGLLGFKGSKKSTPYAANLVARPLLQCPVGLDGAYHSCCQQVRALEAELEKNRRQHLVEMDRQTDRLIHADSRGEQAEARVKKLEDEVRIFRQNAPTLRAELRGEDLG